MRDIRNIPKVISVAMLAENLKGIAFLSELLAGTEKGNFMFWPLLSEAHSIVFAYTFAKDDFKLANERNMKMIIKTTEQIRKAIKNENARIERRFRKANKSLIEKNGGKIRGCLVG